MDRNTEIIRQLSHENKKWFDLSDINRMKITFDEIDDLIRKGTFAPESRITIQESPS